MSYDLARLFRRGEVCRGTGFQASLPAVSVWLVFICLGYGNCRSDAHCEADDDVEDAYGGPAFSCFVVRFVRSCPSNVIVDRRLSQCDRRNVVQMANLHVAMGFHGGVVEKNMNVCLWHELPIERAA